MDEIAKQSAEARLPAAWRMEVWVPVLLVPAHGLASLFLNPIGRHVRSESIEFLLMGSLLCQPLVCALWAAWSSHALKWRLPLAAATCGLLALIACARDGDLYVALVFCGFFLTFFAGLALLRRLGRFCLAVRSKSEGDGPDETPNQFTIRYLIAAMTVVALLVSLGKYVFFSQLDYGEGWAFVGQLFAFVGVFGLSLLPVISVSMIALGDRRQLFVLFLACIPGTAVCTLLAVVVLRWIEPASSSEPLLELWIVIAMITAGAALTMLASTLALRWAGYRIISEPRHA